MISLLLKRLPQAVHGYCKSHVRTLVHLHEEGGLDDGVGEEIHVGVALQSCVPYDVLLTPLLS